MCTSIYYYALLSVGVFTDLELPTLARQAFFLLKKSLQPSFLSFMQTGGVSFPPSICVSASLLLFYRPYRETFYEAGWAFARAISRVSWKEEGKKEREHVDGDTFPGLSLQAKAALSSLLPSGPACLEEQ